MKLASFAFVAAISLVQSAFARFSPSFTFDELLKMSDLVVVMEHETTAASDARDSQGGKGRTTTAKILAQLKGEAKSEKITIHHFFYPGSPQAPNHVTFPPEDAVACSLRTAPPNGRRTLIITPTRRYLAFLKKQDDGSYLPVTPQFDSNLSFVPVGSDLNQLWTWPSESGVNEREGKPSGIRQFIEEEPGE